MKLNSVMSHNFANIPKADIPRSMFKRSSGLKTTFDAGYLVPVFCDEVLPGDSFDMKVNFFGRLSTPIVPFMDNLFLDMHFFFVPNRLVWDNWEKFNGAQKNPGDSTDYLIPYVEAPPAPAYGFSVGSIFDYFGLPTNAPGIRINALPLRAYNLIYNEWYRDENLQISAPVLMGDGPDNIANYPLQRRGKRHDYITSCLPWPQKGPSVPIPMASSAPVNSVLSTLSFQGASSSGIVRNLNYSVGAASAVSWLTAPGVNEVARLQAGINIGTADTSGIAGTINQLRQAFQLQKLYERDARGGTRYTEIIRAHFGVVSPDARLQRPEFLGSASQPINIHPIAQTSSTDGTSPQGNLAGMGTVSGRFNGFNKSFTEHGYIIGLASVRADLSYQQNLDRMWTRKTRWDFFWPALSGIGEQAVLVQEVRCTGTLSDDDVFGYNERYAEYRYKQSQITGKMRSAAPDSLDIWHLAQWFSTTPSLNSAFIEENPPIDRVLAVPSEPDILFDAYFDLKCARPMPAYSVPGLVDHF